MKARPGAARRSELPWGWRRADGTRREAQLDLFPRDRDEVLAAAGVSLDDLARWRERGWISFDAKALGALDAPLIAEVAFIRNLARSGLPDALIGRLLQELEPPYRYDPTRTAYSFAYGWVQPPPVADDDEVEDFLKERLPAWLFDKAVIGELKVLTDLQETVETAVARCRSYLRGKAAFE